ncbi:MAG TPA: efflux RND transporter periplasmic adaptor subunit [Bryobacteraceae bacterium]|nr:efflux RND transporter periplasmic adaptor subunit [Bryobacteraceae bacterium]
MKRKLMFTAPAVLILLALAAWGIDWKQMVSAAAPEAMPVARVRRGDVTIAVTARGELQGGNSEMLAAPMTGGNEMAITSLRSPGELVEAGEVVVQFDTTEQEFKLREAEADLAEAEQQVIQATNDSAAKEEDTRYALLQAKAEVKLAELECRRNEVVAAIVAKQNLLALEAAHDRLRQIQQDLGNQKATSSASIAIQQAARNKARVQADTARRNIENMTLKAKSTGYVNVQQNSSGNFMYWGMQLPSFQVGDTVRAGMGVAQIPDLKNWEVHARIGELDQGHLAVGQKAAISVPALAGKRFTGSVKSIGGTTGPPWDRRFDCRLTLDNPSPELRPGMSARIVITTGVLSAALWVPSQALFESDGRKFVYLQSGGAFVPHDVKLVRRSESQVVLTGVNEGQTVALAGPDEQNRKSAAPASAAKAIPK